MISVRAFVRRCGAYLALAALTLQLVLSYSHIHKQELVVPRIDRADAVGVTHAHGAPQLAERQPSRLSDDEDHCPICFSGFLLSNSSLPDASANPAWSQLAEIDRPLNPVSDPVLRPRHAAFLSRAPPTA